MARASDTLRLHSLGVDENYQATLRVATPSGQIRQVPLDQNELLNLMESASLALRVLLDRKDT